MVHRNGLRLLKLVNTLLDFSRIEAGRAQAVYEETDLTEFTADLASVFRSAIEKAGLSLIVNCSPLPEPVFVDRDMWEKIVLNLISNAFKFTFAGEIEVALRPSGRYVTLSIRDTGTGIPQDELGKIFERFHRIAGSHGRTYEGTGIGLSLVQELVRLHGGSISAESVYGKGSTFFVSIPLGKNHLSQTHIGVTREKTVTMLSAMPLAEEAARWLRDANEEEEVASGALADPAQLPSPLQPIHSSLVTTPVPTPPRFRLLLADDNADMRKYVSRLLKGRYGVMAVSNGKAALEAVRRSPPDLILTDVMMPRLDGFGLVRALRDNPATKTIPIILLSARDGEESHIEGLEHGADDYLIKPFSARELLARVNMHVKMARLRHEAEDALRASEERFRTFTRATSDVVYCMSPDWAEMRYLQGREFIADTVEPTQTWLSKYIHPGDQRHVVETIQRAIQSKQVFELEHRVIRMDGSLGWAHSRAIPIFDNRGEIVEWFGAASDVTQRKEAVEKLAEQQRLFTQDLEAQVKERTRDLKQSQDRLRTMAAELDLAEQRERKRVATELHDHLQQILVLGRITLGQGRRAAAGVPACLDVMSKMDDILTEALTYTRTLVADLSPLVLRDHGLAADLKWLGEYMKKHQITVTVTMPEKDNLRLPEDQAVLLFQSVRELLINSSKHAGTGQAHVRLEWNDRHLRIEVRDQGVGFDLTATTAAVAPNGGISSKFGLFSIQERMRALGGSLELESAPGKGTTATLVLPLLSRAEDQGLNSESSGTAATLRSRDSASNNKMPIRVLLVDDHAMMRQGLRSIVTGYDHLEVVGEASDGAEAVELTQQLNPDVVVMDVNMPKMEGIEATQHIKAKQPATVVIGLSVSQSANTEEKMEAAGASAYLTKESAVDALCYAIEQAVSHKQQQAP